MKNTFIYLFFTLSFTSLGQQKNKTKTAAPQEYIGINNPNPTEALDVTGNMNLTGTIKANGTAPAPNQQLINNSHNNLEWVSIKSNFQNFRGFAANDTWVVPAGIDVIYVELWGGGGGGGIQAGGGGGFGQCQLFVVPGEIVTITVGAGGTGQVGVATANNGGFSKVATNIYLHQFQINGGFAGNDIFAGKGGSLGGSSSGLPGYKYLQGQTGKNTIVKYSQKNATTFVKLYEFGKGGDGANTINTGGDGAYLTENESNGFQEFFAYPYNGSFPGGGGGGSRTSNAGNGAQGYAVIYW